MSSLKSLYLKAILTVLCGIILSVNLTLAAESRKNENAETDARTPGGGFALGALAGVGSVGNDIGVRIPFGLNLLYRPRAFGGMAGAYFLHTGLGSTSVGVNRGEINAWGAEFAYAPGEDAGGLQIGARIGLAHLNLLGAETETHLGFGPRIGYDYMVNAVFSLGGELSATVVTTGPILTILGFNGGAKLWF